MMTHATDRQTRHACGGTVLTASHDGSTYDYCDTCHAFAYDGEPIPNGTDKRANRAAWDLGEETSPDADGEG